MQSSDLARCHVYDRIARNDYPTEFGGRALRTPFLERWTGHDHELPENPAALSGYKPSEKIYAGQSVGVLGMVRPAATIVVELTAHAYGLLHAVGRDRTRYAKPGLVRERSSDVGTILIRFQFAATPGGTVFLVPTPTPRC